MKITNGILVVNKPSNMTSRDVVNILNKKFNTKKAKTIYLKKLKAGKKYYVQTRAFVKSGKKIAYSKWSKQKTLTAKK